jgi:hypothetical protein
MESLPSELVSFMALLRPLFRAEVFASFCYLIVGILIGEAKAGTVRASVFAGAGDWPQRLSDLCCRHKLSHQALMAKLVEVALASLYPAGLPARLLWIADATYTEKPSAKRMASIGLFHCTKRVAGQAKHLQGHWYVFAAHLYQHSIAKASKWARVLVGAVLYVKGRSIPALVGVLAQQLRLPAEVRHVWLVDRGILSRPLLRALGKLGHGVVGRVRCNQVVYFAPPAATRPPTTRQRRPRVYGPKCRMAQWRTHCGDRLREQKMLCQVHGRERIVRIWEAVVLVRGVWRGRALPARVIILVVPGLKLKPWYLLTTDLELDPRDAVRAYDGRYQIEVNRDEVKELGLGHYHGRSGQGVRRWPLLLCLGQMILKFIATRVLPVQLPTRHWSWYEREDTVGQVRRRLIAACHPRISRIKMVGAIQQKSTKAA